MRATETQDVSHAVFEMPFWRRIKEDGGFDYGFVRTRDGIVEAYSSPGGKEYPRGYTRLEFTKNGRTFTRHINAHYSRRFLVTLAKRFAREIAEQA